MYTIVTHPHIEKTPSICGGEPVIKGTRISVRLIAELERLGKSVDEIIALYPHLTHAEVYDALSYYYDNKEEIARYIEESSEAYIKEQYKNEPWAK
jgi:uncharacterized protein (DUF433 family)